MDRGWHDYRREMFGDPYLVWHEGADFTALLATTGAERERAARMLLVGLDAQDALAAQGLRELRLVAAAPELRAATAAGREPELRVRAAQALYALTGEAGWSRVVAAVLDSPAPWGARVSAAHVLREFAPTPELVDRLAAAVRDPEYLVRYHAAETLLGYAGRRPDLAHHRRWFPRLAAPGGQAPPSEQDVAGWHAIAAELAAAAESATAAAPADPPAPAAPAGP
ncbi:hypothetical protein GCM10009665_03080 [Kitasatospora nipponensis]|uniref:HEAT repeat protein n=1 Tax=Kitasatospora nipponensis TaxID=258049 RepID=A0ABP4G8B5_9ACTN